MTADADKAESAACKMKSDANKEAFDDKHKLTQELRKHFFFLQQLENKAQRSGEYQEEWKKIQSIAHKMTSGLEEPENSAETTQAA